MRDHPIVTIGEIAQVKGGKRLPKGMSVQDEKTTHPYIRVTDFHGGILDRHSVTLISQGAFLASQIGKYS